jgi:beta-ketoacyl synthase-like protein
VDSQVVSFSVASFAAWAPGVTTQEAWIAWARGELGFSGDREPPVKPMAPMMRRRAGFLSKMALEVAYDCLGRKVDVPTIFCSRHGEALRSVELLTDLANAVPLSPTSFGLSVHNATAGLFSIARGDHANSIALSAGASGVEHAVIEACGLLAEGAAEVLLVVYDCPLPAIYASFQDCDEQPFAWAWLLQSAREAGYSLRWRETENVRSHNGLPGSLEIFRFFLLMDPVLERASDGRQWIWTRHAK